MRNQENKKKSKNLDRINRRPEGKKTIECPKKKRNAKMLKKKKLESKRKEND